MAWLCVRCWLMRQMMPSHDVRCAHTCVTIRPAWTVYASGSLRSGRRDVSTWIGGNVVATFSGSVDASPARVRRATSARTRSIGFGSSVGAPSCRRGGDWMRCCIRCFHSYGATCSRGVGNMLQRPESHVFWLGLPSRSSVRGQTQTKNRNLRTGLDGGESGARQDA